jgi:uncharacterized membrane protein YgcG
MSSFRTIRMLMKSPLWLGLLLAIGLGLIWQTNSAQAQDKTLVWDRYDVNLTVEPNSDILVEEIQEIDFSSGTFRFGFASIPLDRVEDITDISVSEINPNGTEQSYTPNSTGQYGFTTGVNEGNLEVTWYFPPTSNSRHTYVLRYRVKGGLRMYDEGDQVWWKAIAPDHNFPIRNATVTVTPPETFRKSELTVDSYGAPVEGASYTDRGSVVFVAREIPPGEELEVRVQFPHGVVEGQPPDWQAADDLRRQFGPAVGVLAGALGLVLLVGGPVAIYLLWYTRGRDTEAVLAPEYLSEPPADLPAAIVGTLVDEHADMKDIIASILDLADRGAIRMEEQAKSSSWGVGTSHEFIFYLEDESKAIYPHEEQLLLRIFGKKGKMRNERKLRDLREKFYTAIPDLKRMLYAEVVDKGFFPSSPDSTRQRWTWLGIIGLVFSAGASFCALLLLGDFSPAVACPGIALVASMIALIFVGRHMPRKTPLGTEEAAKWLAFKRYLENIEEYSDLDTVKDKFEQYLPYATAFGLERRFIRKFSTVDTPAPSWWGPIMPYGPYPGYGSSPSGAGPVAGGPPGSLAGEASGTPSLSGMSNTLGTSLASMSTGLGTLLNSASSTLTSKPASSSSGGGFSGGGFSGGGSFGGGGGGGSRGFG